MKKFILAAIATITIAAVALIAGIHIGARRTINTAYPYWSQAEPCVIFIDFNGEIHAYNVE